MVTAEAGPLAPPPDPLAPLISRIASGSEQALGALYDATSSRVFGLTLKILRDRPAAEEATIDVYAQVWREASRFDLRRGSALAWLLNLARSRAIDIYRSRSRQSGPEEPLVDILHIADPSPGPESASLEMERARNVRAALRSLPPEQRRAVEAAYFSGMSHSEVAEALGEPLGTVKTRIRAALATLRRALVASDRGIA
ncbi:MAG: sigma-70 family RNA polymerase sigma factor [Acidobacteria bacterium]|nr:sigma-70 family RNA polymerase sigma factor [Acidobacteriota bacterium]